MEQNFTFLLNLIKKQRNKWNVDDSRLSEKTTNEHLGEQKQIGGAERLLLVILPSPKKPTIWLQYLLQSPGSKFETVHKKFISKFNLKNIQPQLSKLKVSLNYYTWENTLHKTKLKKLFQNALTIKYGL